MAGTDSAWNAVSDDSQLFPFLTRIRRGDGGAGKEPVRIVLVN